MQGLQKLTVKRNNKIKDYLHKAGRAAIRLAAQNGVGTIVIGRNYGWKQDISLGNITNQNFVGIPYRMLIEMIRYKAPLVGIRVSDHEESRILQWNPQRSRTGTQNTSSLSNISLSNIR